MMQQVGAFSILWPLNWLRVILSDLVISHHAQAVFDVSTSNLLNDHGVIQPRILYTTTQPSSQLMLFSVHLRQQYYYHDPCSYGLEGARIFFTVCGDAAIENSYREI